MGVDARGFPGGLLRLDPAFAYVEPPSSWPLPRAEYLSGPQHASSTTFLSDWCEFQTCTWQVEVNIWRMPGQLLLFWGLCLLNSQQVEHNLSTKFSPTKLCWTLCSYGQIISQNQSLWQIHTFDLYDMRPFKVLLGRNIKLYSLL